jgi:hypothetical protein
MSFLISYFTRHLNVELKIRPDFRYSACSLAGSPVYDFYIDRISGRPDIRQNQYTVHPKLMDEKINIKTNVLIKSRQ